MLKPLTLLLCLTAPALQAQPLTQAEITAAQTTCATTLAQACLFTLAQNAALSGPAPGSIDMDLTAIAKAQARAGHIAGAERTMTLGPTDPSVLLELGRWDQAYAAAKPDFPNWIVEFGTPEAAFKSAMIAAMLKRGETAFALKTARSLENGNWDEADKALLIILDDRLAHQDHPAALSLVPSIANPQIRNRALRSIAQSQATANHLPDAAATIAQIDPPDPGSLALVMQAQAKSEGDPDQAERLMVQAATLPPPDKSPNDTEWNSFTTLTNRLVTLAQSTDAVATSKAAQDLTNFLSGRFTYRLIQPLNDTALTLIDRGATQTALDLMDRLDHTRFGGIWSDGIAKTLLAHDPSIAPALLPHIQTYYVRLNIAQSWAETLHAQHREAQAQTVLTDLIVWTESRPDTAFLDPAGRATTLAAIAGTQRKLGYAADARATLTRAYDLAQTQKLAPFRVTLYLALAKALTD